VFTRPHTFPIPVLSLTILHILFKIHPSVFPLTPRHSSILICILLYIHSRKLHFNQSWNLVCVPIFFFVQFSSLYATFLRIWSVTVSTKRQISYLASLSNRLLFYEVYDIWSPLSIWFFWFLLQFCFKCVNAKVNNCVISSILSPRNLLHSYKARLTWFLHHCIMFTIHIWILCEAVAEFSSYFWLRIPKSPGYSSPRTACTVSAIQWILSLWNTKLHLCRKSWPLVPVHMQSKMIPKLIFPVLF
jgi:hypothetical protein